MIYTAYLIRWPSQKKKIRFQSDNSSTALAYIHQTFPQWDISMFWFDWSTK